MSSIRIFLVTTVLLGIVSTQSINKVHLGFPEAWDGDKYRELYCPSKNIPKFLGNFITSHFYKFKFQMAISFVN